MKVILIQDVEGLGEAGEVKTVSTGYARNYLIPKEFAIVATPGAIKQWKAQHKALIAREARLAERATELAQEMANVTLAFEAKAGPKGRLYGSVTTAEIAAALERELGIAVDRRKIASDPLREVGEHLVSVQISSEVEAQVKVLVKPEGGEEIEMPEDSPSDEETAEPIEAETADEEENTDEA